MALGPVSLLVGKLLAKMGESPRRRNNRVRDSKRRALQAEAAQVEQKSTATAAAAAAASASAGRVQSLSESSKSSVAELPQSVAVVAVSCGYRGLPIGPIGPG